MQKVIELINARIASHRKELEEIDAYLAEQETEETKVIPRRSAAMLSAYIDEATDILKEVTATPPPVEEWHIKTQAWQSYPEGTLAETTGGGHWIKTKTGWVFIETRAGWVFPECSDESLTPGADATGRVRLPKTTNPPRDAGPIGIITRTPEDGGNIEGTEDGPGVWVPVVLGLILGVVILLASCAPGYGCPALKSSQTAGFAK